MRRRVWFHRAAAIGWVLTLPVALKWWPQSVAFVIVASVYANAYTSWAAAEAASDRDVVERLDRIETMLATLTPEPDEPQE